MSVKPLYADPLYRRPPFSSPGNVERTPVLERIALWHLAAVEAITEANGCYQTLQVARTGNFGAGSPGDLSTICLIGGHCESALEDEDADHYCWRQSFETLVYVIGDNGAGTGEDPRFTAIVADIHKIVATELRDADASRHNCYCGGLAYDIRPMAWIFDWDEKHNLPCIVVPLLISFEHLKLDPCSQ